jgi:uncharacterized membrane protein
MPVQSRSPVNKYTIAATMIAGINTKKSFIKTMIIKPIMTRIISNGMLRALSPKLLRTDIIVSKSMTRFITKNPQEKWVASW